MPDYDALAQKHGGAVDYDALAAKYGSQENAEPDVLEKALNYHTGNTLIDAPLGVAQGAAKGLLQTVNNGAQLVRKIPGMQAADDAYFRLTGGKPMTPEQEAASTAANGIGQGTGKFIEQGLEYARGAGLVSGALKGAPLAARIAGQAALGAGVSGVQSGGDPTSTIVGGVAGGGGELAGAALSGAKKLLGAKAPTLANFAESFGGATPTQKARISAALDTLKKDGIVPADDVYGTRDAINGKLQDLGQQYQALNPAIRQRLLPAGDVINELRAAQSKYTLRGAVTDETAYNALQKQIDIIKHVEQQTGGYVQLDDLLHLKQNANVKTNFANPDKDTWRTIGNAYRKAADTLAPETTPLNRDYQKYSDLREMIEENIARGKGTTRSGLDALLDEASSRAKGAAAGGVIGGQLFGHYGAAAGTVAGGIIGPKLGNTARQMMQNAVDSGAFSKFAPVKRAALATAAQAGDNATVFRLLGRGVAQAEQSSSGGN